jgi:hypothetical protein
MMLTFTCFAGVSLRLWSHCCARSERSLGLRVKVRVCELMLLFGVQQKSDEIRWSKSPPCAAYLLLLLMLFLNFWISGNVFLLRLHRLQPLVSQWVGEKVSGKISIRWNNKWHCLEMTSNYDDSSDGKSCFCSFFRIWIDDEWLKVKRKRDFLLLPLFVPRLNHCVYRRQQLS